MFRIFFFLLAPLERMVCVERTIYEVHDARANSSTRPRPSAREIPPATRAVRVNLKFKFGDCAQYHPQGFHPNSFSFRV